MSITPPSPTALAHAQYGSAVKVLRPPHGGFVKFLLFLTVNIHHSKPHAVGCTSELRAQPILHTQLRN
jgi:hypothetical protein